MKRENSKRQCVEKQKAIKKRQREIAEPYDECRPSEVTDTYWIYAKRKTNDYPKASLRSGKWLVFVPVEQVDKVWSAIKRATEEGRLGDSSKAATARPSPNAQDPNLKVICVYTYDWTDVEDVRRVRQELRELGITRKIAYKTDQDTLSGKYRITGHTRISKYYE